MKGLSDWSLEQDQPACIHVSDTYQTTCPFLSCTFAKVNFWDIKQVNRVLVRSSSTLKSCTRTDGILIPVFIKRHYLLLHFVVTSIFYKLKLFMSLSRSYGYLRNKLEWGCPNGTQYPPRQPIPTFPVFYPWNYRFTGISLTDVESVCEVSWLYV